MFGLFDLFIFILFGFILLALWIYQSWRNHIDKYK